VPVVKTEVGPSKRMTANAGGAKAHMQRIQRRLLRLPGQREGCVLEHGIVADQHDVAVEIRRRGDFQITRRIGGVEVLFVASSRFRDAARR
jgi:hypothetical protein